jgi:DNA-binding GntR family transcriptional regulator
MRVIFERNAAALAAKHASTAEIHVLDDLNALIAAERDNPSRAAAINQEFHRGLYRAGRNRFLLDAAQNMNNALILLGPTTFADEGRIDVVVGQHQAIIDALRAADALAAGDAAAVHLNTSLRHRLRTAADD